MITFTIQNQRCLRIWIWNDFGIRLLRMWCHHFSRLCIYVFCLHTWMLFNLNDWHDTTNLLILFCFTTRVLIDDYWLCVLKLFVFGWWIFIEDIDTCIHVKIILDDDSILIQSLRCCKSISSPIFLLNRINSFLVQSSILFSRIFLLKLCKSCNCIIWDFIIGLMVI